MDENPVPSMRICDSLLPRSSLGPLTGIRSTTFAQKDMMWSIMLVMIAWKDMA